MVERKVVLPPPPPKPPEVKKEEKKEEKKVEDKPKIEKPKPIEKEPVAKPKPTENQVKVAKEKAQQQIASIADDLDAIRNMDVVAISKPSTGGLQKDNGGPAGTSRNMLTSKAGAGSGGVAAYSGGASSGFGGGVAGGSGSKGNHNLGAKGTQNVKGGLIAASGNGAGRGDGEGKTRGEGGIGKRTTEDIRRIFDQNGGRLNNAYQRALKDDPSMEGTVRLKLVVDPSGKVLSCEVASSELNNPELEAKIVSLVKGFNFGDDNVDVWKGTYPVNFYPN
jgi:TonB family protein